MQWPDLFRWLAHVFRVFSEGSAAVPLSCAGLKRWNYYDEIHFMIWTPLILVCASWCAYAWNRVKQSAHVEAAASSVVESATQAEAAAPAELETVTRAKVDMPEPRSDVAAEAEGAAANTDRQQVFYDFQKRAFYIAFLFFPSTVSTLSRMFFCTELFPDGTRWLLADLSLECGNDPIWGLMMGVTIFGLLLCVAFILWLVWLARDELPFGLDERVGKPTRVEKEMLADHLFGAYRPNRKLNEALECVRRVALTLGVYACGKTPASRAWGGAILSLTFTLVHAELRPYSNPTTQAFSGLAHWCSAIHFFAALSIATVRVNDWQLSLFLIFCHVFLVAAAVFRRQFLAVVYSLKRRVNLQVNKARKQFDDAWKSYSLVTRERMLNDCDTMERRVLESCQIWGCSGPPRQPLRDPKSIEELYESAKNEEIALLDAMQKLVETAGGKIHRAPLKGEERVKEKTQQDYDGDYSRVLDVVRATGVWTKPDGIKFASITANIASAAGDDGNLRVVRCKNRFGDPPPSGYRDVMLNVQLREGKHIGELQLQLKELSEVKSVAHVSYEIVRGLHLDADI